MEGDEQEKKAEEVPKSEPEKVPGKEQPEVTRELESRLYLRHFMAQRTTYTVARTENPDSLEIGSQKDGRIKVYGDFSDKTAFSKKVRDAIDITEAAQAAMKKLETTGNGGSSPGG